MRDASAATAAGLSLSVYLPGCGRGDPAQRWGQPGDLVPNANIRITPENRVIFSLGRVEMGQGTLTSQVMIFAEELDLDPALVETEFAPNHSDFADPEFGIQVTGGSSSTRNAYEPLSQAGAIAREALLSAAAARLKVPVPELRFNGKTVVHDETQRSVRFGEIAETARSHLNYKASPKPKDKWAVIGQDHIRLDAQAKVDGSAKYGADYQPDELETAVIIRGPLGSKALKISSQEAEKTKGIKAVLSTPYGIAVVADRYYQARKAAEKVEVTWSESTFSTQAMWKRYTTALDDGEGQGNARYEGSASKVLDAAKDKVIEAEYQLPFLAHATMEPQNCTVSWTPDGAEVWVPTQAPSQCAIAVADTTGLSASKIKVHTTFLGGGFGRRSEVDYVQEAAYLSKARRKPIRIQWSREDDTQNDFYRPASLHRLRGLVGEDKPIVAWEHRIVQQSALERPIPSFLREVMPSPFANAATWAMTSVSNDVTITEGADTIPYAIEHLSVGYKVAHEPVPVGFWRSVGHSSNGFVVESFIDELAHAAQKDPVDFRRKLLSHHPRHLGVLKRVTHEAGWGQPLASGRAHGVAVHESFRSYVAVVAEVSVDNDLIKVHRLTAAVDCGIAIHPDGVRAQIEGGMIFALGPTLTQAEITFQNGRVQQSNFHDFQTLRFGQTPEIAVHIVDSDAPPTGVGEPGVPPTAAAVANAVFALTGHRLRRLPLTLPA